MHLAVENTGSFNLNKCTLQVSWHTDTQNQRIAYYTTENNGKLSLLICKCFAHLMNIVYFRILPSQINNLRNQPAVILSLLVLNSESASIQVLIFSTHLNVVPVKQSSTYT